MGGRTRLPRVTWVGDSAIEVAVGPGRPDLAAVARAQLVGGALLAAAIPEVVDVVPGLRTVLVTLDRSRPPQHPGRLRERVRLEAVRALAVRPRPGRAGSERLVTVPVRYGGDDGPDLAAVAEETGLPAAAVVASHAGRPYTVLALGFRPGFAFLGFVDPRLTVARRSAPRLAVPAGSVGLAGRQTGIYPGEAPGGWRLIGRTAIRLFDPAAASAETACLLRPGDRVLFVADRLGQVVPPDRTGR